MAWDDGKHCCDRCGCVLTIENNKCGYEICDECNEILEERLRRCKNCKHHYHEDIDDGWVCVNPKSVYCTDWTEDDDACPEFEEAKR